MEIILPQILRLLGRRVQNGEAFAHDGEGPANHGLYRLFAAVEGALQWQHRLQFVQV